MALISPPALGAVPSPASLTPVFFSSIFSGETGVGTHQSTDWQIATAKDFNSGSLVYNQNDTVNLNSLTLPQGNLSLRQHYYARIRHRDSLGTISNWSKIAEFNTGLNINTPTASVSSPTPLVPIIVSSPFNGNNTHIRSDWQIATDYHFNNIVEELLDSPSSLTQYTPQSLVFDTLYYVRVRYRDNLLLNSEYSEPVSFYTDTQTNVNPNIDRPSILTPVDNATGVSITPTITASGFTGANGATHVSTTWEIATTTTFGSNSVQAPNAGGTESPQIENTSGLIFRSANDINNKIAITIGTGILEEARTYYVRVRYEYVDLQNTSWYSEWSEPILFNTSAVPAELQCPFVSSIVESTIYDRMDVTTSVFVATQTAGQTHVHSDWQVATDAGFSNLVIVATEDTTNRTTFPIPLDSIRPSTNYYVRVRYYNGSIYSAYSPGYVFQSPATATGTLQDFTRVQTDTLDDLSVSTNKIINLSVTTPKLGDNAVTAAKIAPGGIIDSNLQNGAITEPKLYQVSGSEAVTTPTMRDGAVTSPKLADGAATSSKIDITGATDPVSPVEGQVFYNTAQSTFKTYNGVDWKESGDAGDYYIIRKPQPGDTNLTVVYAGRQTNISYSEYSSNLNTHQFFAPSGLDFNIDSNGHLVVTVR